MSIINITGTRPVTDIYFRYTMPALSICYEGRGNGQKTIILNLKDISDSLDRPIETLIRYFSIELCTQCRKETNTTRVIINGTFTSQKLLDILNTYIDIFVLCPTCSLPETLLTIKKDVVGHKCKSCGKKTPIVSNHKLVKTIIKMFSS